MTDLLVNVGAFSATSLHPPHQISYDNVHFAALGLQNLIPSFEYFISSD